MATLREIKQRIGSIKNISQVTNAMQLVAASRMRKAQENAARGKLYALKIYEIMTNLSRQHKSLSNPYIDVNYSNADKVLVVAFSTQRGLAGALPSSLLKEATKFANKIIDTKKKIEFVTVGRKLRDQLIARNLSVIADFSDIPEFPTTKDIQPITRLLTDSYLAKEYSDIFFLYSDFINSMTQVARVVHILPLSVESMDIPNTSGIRATTVFEPNEDDILTHLIPTYIETQIFQKRLETIASEYSSRMMAMKGASDNAKDIMNDLKIEFNKKRQAAITQELAEINGARK